LKTVLINGEFIESGSRLELEIRAASVVGVDLLTRALQVSRQDYSINVLSANNFLWGISKTKEQMPERVFSEEWLPHHYTITTDY